MSTVGGATVMEVPRRSAQAMSVLTCSVISVGARQAASATPSPRTTTLRIASEGTTARAQPRPRNSATSFSAAA